MTRQPDLSQAIERVPGWSTDNVQVQTQPGGLSNTSFRVLHRGEQFVLRLGDAKTADSSRNRKLEAAIHRQAAAADLAPEIVFSDPGADILVTRYLEGRTLQQPDFSESATLESIAKLLREVHALPLTGHAFDGVGAARYYASKMPESAAAPANLAEAEVCIEVIDQLPPASSLCCCHNDVIAENLHRGSDRLRLLDWEYARDNDPYFDIASLIVYNELNEEQGRRLLQAYQPDAGVAESTHLAACMQAYDALYWLWRAAHYQ